MKESNSISSKEKLLNLKKLFSEHADAQKAMREKAYMRNLFPFFGIPKKLLRDLIKQWLKKNPITSSDDLVQLVEALYQMKQREFHYTAIEILRKYHKLYTEEYFSLFEMLVRNHSWWDSVDEIAAHLVGPLLKKYPTLERHMDDWVEDPYMWIRRTAVLYQIRYKDTTDKKRLFRYCQKLFSENEFFIRKVIGWSLREYSKTSPGSVRAFLSINKEKMSGLSYREASKYI